MATIFKNPHLTDYFVLAKEVTPTTPLENVRSYVDEYEAAKVVYFPNLRLDIDFDFWANVPTDKYPGMKKMVCHVDMNEQENLIHKALQKAEAPPGLYDLLWSNMEKLFRQVMPFYYRIFDGYSFPSRRAAIWRLNTTMNENLHIDTYKEEFPEHFARMFINLDNQPRIWHTSYTCDEMYDKFGHKVTRKTLETTTTNRFWREFNVAAFGGGQEWYDGEPRHVIYFDPGDIWIVDSRQVAHQIYYGRRAISIDLFADVNSMKDPNKHYFSLAEKYRGGLLRAMAA